MNYSEMTPTELLRLVEPYIEKLAKEKLPKENDREDREEIINDSKRKFLHAVDPKMVRESENFKPFGLARKITTNSIKSRKRKPSKSIENITSSLYEKIKTKTDRNTSYYDVLPSRGLSIPEQLLFEKWAPIIEKRFIKSLVNEYLNLPAHKKAIFLCMYLRQKSPLETLDELIRLGYTRVKSDSIRREFDRIKQRMIEKACKKLLKSKIRTVLSKQSIKQGLGALLNRSEQIIDFPETTED